MNLYLLFFSFYGLMILPLNLHFRLRLGQNTGYWLRVETVGLPFSGSKSSKTLEEEEKGKPSMSKAHSLSKINFQLLHALTEKKSLRRLFELGRLNRLNLYLRIAFEDAAQTALLFGFSRVLLDTLTKTGALPDCFHFRLRADFQSSGSMLLLDGILSARLGKLLATFMLLGWSYRRRRLPMPPAKRQPTA